MPWDSSSNADQLAARVRALADGFRFDGNGGVADTGFGRDLAAAATSGIAARVLGDQTQPDGSPLAANRGKYGERKRGAGLPVGVGFKGKRSKGRPMFSGAELQGTVQYRDEGREVEIRYGTSDEARKKAGWFVAGSQGAFGCEPSGAKGQPPRPFWGIDAGTRAEMVEVARDHIGRIIRLIRSS